MGIRVEHLVHSSILHPQTYRNVSESPDTLWLSSWLNSSGAQGTIPCLKQYGCRFSFELTRVGYVTCFKLCKSRICVWMGSLSRQITWRNPLMRSHSTREVWRGKEEGSGHGYWSPAPVVCGKMNRKVSFKVSVHYQKAAAELQATAQRLRRRDEQREEWQGE